MGSDAGFLDIDGARIYYEDRGAGDGVIMIHGFAMDTRIFDMQFERFAERFRVVRYDLRGFGKSDLPTGQYSTLDDLRIMMDRLGLDYVDLYLIHWPIPKRGLYIETWKAFEEIYQAGRPKAIGIPTFMPEAIHTLLEASAIAPMVNQFEAHPSFQHRAFEEASRKAGMAVEAVLLNNFLSFWFGQYFTHPNYLKVLSL